MLDWIANIIADMGYLGITLLMFLENIFPPIPSEIVMPLAGFVAARGDLNLAGVTIAGMLGSVLGALPWYFAGRLLGEERLKAWADRHGRWLTVTPSELDKALDGFLRHGGKMVLFGRLVPTIRTLISVPAGFACMRLPRFLIYSIVGTVLWSGLLAWAGYLLQSEYHTVADYLGPVSVAILVGIVLAYIYRVVTYPRQVGSRR
ncbi:DedA family protein [Nitrococcus mobilis]|uniref:DedA family protein n=1 Tax=Nitrococcus mobilis Nb-231 TaxID=314278 RepID=A4BRN3_9GAMM|nr:DedA family protein [Nitrococcus mobilis]EAR21604.1 DedA family protein [Nitrococcus mobilis Nb-231]